MGKIFCTEVSSGSCFAGEMFHAAFQDDLPAWGHHLLLMYRRDDGFFLPLTYLNFLEHENVMLVGGGVTSGKSFQHVDPEDARQIRAEGGGLYKLLRYGFETFADQCDAYFGHAGNPRAYEVDMKAGFVSTKYEHLIVNFHKPLDETVKESLIDRIHSIGSF